MSNRAEYLVNNEGGKNHHLISQFNRRENNAQLVTLSWKLVFALLNLDFHDCRNVVPDTSPPDSDNLLPR